jgi:hypothetical protein
LLERNIVVAGPGGDRCGLEIPLVYRDVTALGSSVARRESAT